LDLYVTQTRFALPRSYREYILQFGPGRLLTDWDIAAPGCTEMNEKWDLTWLHENIRREEDELRYWPDTAHGRLRRCLFFCSKYKDIYGWDPAEVCDSEAHECAIYRFCEDHTVVLAGKTFREFVEGAADAILSEDWDEEECGPR